MPKRLNFLTQTFKWFTFGYELLILMNIELVRA
jgi:hypothetical protein